MVNGFPGVRAVSTTVPLPTAAVTSLNSGIDRDCAFAVNNATTPAATVAASVSVAVYVMVFPVASP